MLFLSIFYFAILSSWYVCYSNDFCYPIAYVTADMGEKIQESVQSDEKYAAFASADAGQSIGLFHRLLKCIEKNGEGLNELSYTDSGGIRRRFLNSAEAESLNGIADMLALLRSMFRPFFLLLVLVCGYMAAVKVRPYAWRQTARTLSYIFTAFTAVFYVYGFDRLLNFIQKIIFGSGFELLFRDGRGLLSLVVPYPSMYFFLWGLFLLTALGCFGLYYLLTGAVVNFFIGKKYQ